MKCLTSDDCENARKEFNIALHMALRSAGDPNALAAAQAVAIAKAENWSRTEALICGDLRSIGDGLGF